MVLDGDAGVVGDLLAHAGEAIEEGGLAAVGRADERDGADVASARLVAVRRAGLVVRTVRGSCRRLGDGDGGCRSAAVHRVSAFRSG